MPDELLGAVVLFLVGSTLIALSLLFIKRFSPYSKTSKKEISAGTKNAVALLKYLQGIKSFQAGKGAFLELFPDKITITQHKVATLSLQYSQITEVAEHYVQQTVSTLEHDYLRSEDHFVNKLETEPCLIIRFIDEHGEKRSIFFQKVGGIEQFTFFRQCFQDKVQQRHLNNTTL